MKICKRIRVFSLIPYLYNQQKQNLIFLVESKRGLRNWNEKNERVFFPPINLKPLFPKSDRSSFFIHHDIVGISEIRDIRQRREKTVSSVSFHSLLIHSSINPNLFLFLIVIADSIRLIFEVLMHTIATKSLSTITVTFFSNFNSNLK